MKKILLVTNSHHLPQGVGGSEKSIHDLARIYLAIGYEVTVVSALAATGWTYWRTRFCRVFSRREWFSDYGLGYRVCRGWYKSNTVAWIVNELARSEGCFDLVFVQGARPMDLMLGIESSVAKKIVLSLVDVEAENICGFDASVEPPEVVTNSEFTRERLLRRYGIDSRVIYPPIILDESVVASARPAIKQYVGFVNPHPYKGIDIVLGLAEAFPEQRFLVREAWGLKPEYKSELMHRIRRCGNVVLTPPSSNMADFYSAIRVLLVPSQYEEAFGRVVVEAQANGVPVIASARGGLPEAVGPAGLLVSDFGSLAAWEQALHSLLGQENLFAQIKMNGLRRFETGVFSMEGQMAIYKELAE